MTTLAQIVEDCRQRYNAVGDKFFADQELVDLVYEAEMELCQDTEGLEKIYTTATVASQREYDYPSQTIRIFRITWNGKRLHPLDFIEDDAITGADETTSSTGEPDFYCIFADRLFLRPVPNAAQTLKIYSVSAPIELTSTSSSMNIKEQYRVFVKDFVLSQMFAKDKNGPLTSYYEGRWQRHVKRIRRLERIRKEGDVYKTINQEELVGIRNLEL